MIRYDYFNLCRLIYSLVPLPRTVVGHSPQTLALYRNSKTRADIYELLGSWEQFVASVPKPL